MPCKIGVIKVLGKLFDRDERELNEGESPYLFGYPDSDEPKTIPYYWWFQYLKRHEGYRTCCEQGGRGEFAELYLDWGDVRTDDFDEWFHQYGDGLFREPHVPDKLMEVKHPSELDGLDWNSVMVVISPFRIGTKLLSKRDIKRQFSMMVDARFTDRSAGRPTYESAAKYRVVGYPNLRVLCEMLDVYDLRKAEPDLTLWQIGERLHNEVRMLSGNGHITDPSAPKGHGADKRMVMTSIVSRHLRIAKAYIHSSVGEFFPMK